MQVEFKFIAHKSCTKCIHYTEVTDDQKERVIASFCWLKQNRYMFNTDNLESRCIKFKNVFGDKKL